jgi:hypothetical protein
MGSSGGFIMNQRRPLHIPKSSSTELSTLKKKTPSSSKSPRRLQISSFMGNRLKDRQVSLENLNTGDTSRGPKPNDNEFIRIRSKYQESVSITPNEPLNLNQRNCDSLAEIQNGIKANNDYHLQASSRSNAWSSNPKASAFIGVDNSKSQGTYSGLFPKNSSAMKFQTDNREANNVRPDVQSKRLSPLKPMSISGIGGDNSPFRFPKHSENKTPFHLQLSAIPEKSRSIEPSKKHKITKSYNSKH